jgi:hypothetical protein
MKTIKIYLRNDYCIIIPVQLWIFDERKRIYKDLEDEK